MDKLSIYLVIFWIVLAIIFIVGQFCGASLFFVICNDIFAAYNALAILGLIPQLFKEIKKLKKKDVL